jgi:ATP-dependent DNA helicase RecG
LLVQKGKNKFTYYVPSPILFALISGDKVSLSAPPAELNAQPQSLSVPPFIQDKIILIGKRAKSKEIINEVILDLCEWKPLKIKEIAKLIGKSEKYLLRGYIQPLLIEKKLQYTVPDMINHPDQAYTTLNKLI